MNENDKIKIVNYHSTTDNKNKVLLMDMIVESLRNNNKYVIVDCKKKIKINANISIMFAYYIHNLLKSKNELQNYKYSLLKNNDSLWIFIDADPFSNMNKEPKCRYFRLAIGSIFYDQSINYSPQNMDNTRITTILKKKNIRIKPYREKGEHILVALQSTNSFSMKDTNIFTWLEETLTKIRTISQRKIIIRLKDNSSRKGVINILNKNQFSNISITVNNASTKPHAPTNNLDKDLHNAWVTVLYTTSLGITSLLYGIPVIALNPSALVYEIADHDLSFIENPTLYDREQFFMKLSYSIWSIKEMKNGVFWKALEDNYLSKIYPSIFNQSST